MFVHDHLILYFLEYPFFLNKRLPRLDAKGKLSSNANKCRVSYKSWVLAEGGCDIFPCTHVPVLCLWYLQKPKWPRHRTGMHPMMNPSLSPKTGWLSYLFPIFSVKYQFFPNQWNPDARYCACRCIDLPSLVQTVTKLPCQQSKHKITSNK